MTRSVREYLKDSILLFDGAMGTYLNTLDRRFRTSPEQANLDRPELVARIHGEYLDAGAMAITTNTFGANRDNYPDTWKMIIQQGFRIAQQEAGRRNAFVFADIGPVDTQDDEVEEDNQYIEQARLFLSLGATNFIFETHSMFHGIDEAAQFIKKMCPEAFIIASFAVLPDGFTRDGIFASQLAKSVSECPCIDSFGMNCIQDATHMNEQAQRLELGDKVLCLMPNAGYPTVLGHRIFYEGDPLFYAQAVAQMAGAGARILGGCCGTTPIHIQRIRELLPKPGAKGQSAAEDSESQLSDNVRSHFWDSLTSGKKPIAVELDPPENASLEKFIKGATRLRDADVDVITLADCPIGRARMDSSILACKVRRELGMDVLPHLTCRDRNINATKALLLGLYAESVRNVLLVTGDPIPSAERDEVKSVYQFNSRKLSAFVSELGKQILPSEFHIFGALNINARNFGMQLKLAKAKIENGMVGFLTQPVLTERAIENLKQAHEELDAYILGGLIPIVSERNARYMDSEVNGICVDPKIIEAYVGKDKARCNELAVTITVDFARRIADYVDGYYIVTPFGRASLTERIVKEIRR